MQRNLCQKSGGFEIMTELRKREEALAKKGYFEDLLRGKMTKEAYFEKLGLSVSQKKVEEALFKNLRREIPKTRRVLKKIKTHPANTNKGALTVSGRPPIYIVSDHVDGWYQKAQEFHPKVFDLADGCFWSCRIGKTVSDSGFFPKLLDRIGQCPEEVVFIDDRETNVKAAQEAGIVSIQFENADILKKELEQLGFSFAK